MSILNEVEFQYSSGLATKLKPFLGKGLFIHFGETPKMGVNTRPGVKADRGHHWGDPSGVYFYDLDWLVKHDNFINGQQFATTYSKDSKGFGTDFRFWTVVALTETNGVQLSKITPEQVDTIAETNHWTDWDENKFKLIKADYNTPAKLFWGFIRACASKTRTEDGKTVMPQNAALRGIDYIWDDGLGIINPHEANQLLVVNPRAVRVMGSGDFVSYANGSFQRPNDPKHPLGDMKLAVVELLKRIRGEYGGDLTWMKNKPALHFTKNNASFAITFETGSYDGGSLYMDCRWGRARKSFSLSISRFKTGSMDMAVKFFADVVERISAFAAKGRDLLFTPSMTEAEARAELSKLVAEGSKITTEIDNERKTMAVTTERTVSFGPRGSLWSIVDISVTDKKARYIATVKVNGYHISHGRADSAEGLIQQLEETLQEQIDAGDPKNTEKYVKKFYYEDDLKAFVGMVAELSGIRALQIKYSSEAELFRNNKHKDDIYSDANRVYGSY